MAEIAPQVVAVGEPRQARYGFGRRITGETVWHSGETIDFHNEPEPYRIALEIGALLQRG